MAFWLESLSVYRSINGLNVNAGHGGNFCRGLLIGERPEEIGV
jgi:hypothetical protein